MRYFIALELPDSSTSEIKQVQDKLKEILPNVRVTNPNKLHLTIAFIGEQPDEMKNSLIEALREAASGIQSFAVSPGYIDGFPNLHHAHILWMGMKGDVDKLMVLREKIKDSLIKIGLDEDERRYIPHIAIAKADNFHLEEGTEEKLQHIIHDQFTPIQINSIKLFESIPSHGFHEHNTLAEIPLE